MCTRRYGQDLTLVRCAANTKIVHTDTDGTLAGGLRADDDCVDLLIHSKCAVGFFRVLGVAFEIAGTGTEVKVIRTMAPCPTIKRWRVFRVIDSWLAKRTDRISQSDTPTRRDIAVWAHGHRAASAEAEY